MLDSRIKELQKKHDQVKTERAIAESRLAELRKTLESQGYSFSSSYDDVEGFYQEAKALRERLQVEYDRKLKLQEALLNAWESRDFDTMKQLLASEEAPSPETPSVGFVL